MAKYLEFWLILIVSPVLLFAEDNFYLLHNEIELLQTKIYDIKTSIEEEIQKIETQPGISVEKDGVCSAEDMRRIVVMSIKLIKFHNGQMSKSAESALARIMEKDELNKLKSFLESFKRNPLRAEAKEKMVDEMGKGIEMLGNMVKSIEDNNKKVTNAIGKKQKRMATVAKEDRDKLAIEIEILQGILAFPDVFKKQMGQAQAEQRRRKAEAYKKERPAGLDNKEDKWIKALGKERLIEEHRNLEGNFKKVKTIEKLLEVAIQLALMMMNVEEGRFSMKAIKDDAMIHCQILMILAKEMGFDFEQKLDIQSKGSRRNRLWKMKLKARLRYWWTQLKEGPMEFVLFWPIQLVNSVKRRFFKPNLEKIVKKLTDATEDITFGLVAEFYELYNPLKNKENVEKYLKMEEFLKKQAQSMVCIENLGVIKNACYPKPEHILEMDNSKEYSEQIEKEYKEYMEATNRSCFTNP